MREVETIGVAGGIRKKGGAARLVVGDTVQANGQFPRVGLDRRVVQFGPSRRRAEPIERSVIVVPAWLQRDDVGLSLTNGARGATPAAKFDIAGDVKFGRV